MSNETILIEKCIEFKGKIFAKQVNESVNEVIGKINQVYHGLKNDTIYFNSRESNDYPGFLFHGVEYKITENEKYTIQFICKLTKENGKISPKPLFIQILSYSPIHNGNYGDFFIMKNIQKQENIEGDECECKGKFWDVEFLEGKSLKGDKRTFIKICCAARRCTGRECSKEFNEKKILDHNK